MKLLQDFIKTGHITNHFEFVFEKGEHADESYEVGMDIACDNPNCRCGDLWLIAKSIADKKEAADTRIREYTFPLNVVNKEISKAHKKDLSRYDRNFAHSFVAELTNPDWSNLMSFLHAQKRYLTEQCDIDALDADFPYTDIESTGLMVSYHQVLPYAADIMCSYRGSKYLVDDQYCLKSSCDCSEATLTFIRIEDDAFEYTSSQAVIRYDYKKRSWKTEYDYHDNPGALPSIVQDLTHSVQGFHGILKKHHGQLQRMYRNFKKRKNLVLVGPGEMKETKKKKTGRNDPCPCGSGKKYKKCCAR